jgi:putative NADH-flavin reductase
MARVFIFGATGSLGRCVLRQAVESGHDVTVFVRDPSKLSSEMSTRIDVRRGDLLQSGADDIAQLVRGQQVVLNCAGHVADGQKFVELVDRIVDGVERIEPSGRPVCWFLAGAALLDIGESGRRGVDLPKVKNTYWPHRANFERLQRSALVWSLLCPGPMVDQAPVGLDALRVSTDRLPVPIPGVSRFLPAPLLLPIFASRIPEMIIPYADAAALMLAHLGADGELTRRRVGIALPAGMKGRKATWTAKRG